MQWTEQLDGRGREHGEDDKSSNAEVEKEKRVEGKDRGEGLGTDFYQLGCTEYQSHGGSVGVTAAGQGPRDPNEHKGNRTGARERERGERGEGGEQRPTIGRGGGRGKGNRQRTETATNTRTNSGFGFFNPAVWGFKHTLTGSRALQHCGSPLVSQVHIHHLLLLISDQRQMEFNPYKTKPATDDVPSSCISVTVTMSAPAKRPATRVTSAPVSVAAAILPKSARQHGTRPGGNGGWHGNRGSRRLEAPGVCPHINITMTHIDPPTARLLHHEDKVASIVTERERAGASVKNRMEQKKSPRGWESIAGRSAYGPHLGTMGMENDWLDELPDCER
ncbi:hypothetical protein EYF80_022586 [Liparis tanakae]|uniref:Uncharacterized protein n=1 Tax=Liparis tanakae TaxID=230148 RepID=A0A4Z2HMS2_9TELE|nr:hypothetical protein EYF80_022586 [Liparis tanakae]